MKQSRESPLNTNNVSRRKDYSLLQQTATTEVAAPKRSRLKNDIGKILGSQIDTEKAADRPVKLVRNRVAAKGARLLFRELVKVHRQNDSPDNTTDSSDNINY